MASTAKTAGQKADFKRELTEVVPHLRAFARGLCGRPDMADDLVVIHGDPSLPNMILGPGGLSGWVDVGRAGVGSRWCDLMIGATSVAPMPRVPGKVSA